MNQELIQNLNNYWNHIGLKSKNEILDYTMINQELKNKMLESKDFANFENSEIAEIFSGIDKMLMARIPKNLQGELKNFQKNFQKKHPNQF